MKKRHNISLALAVACGIGLYLVGSNEKEDQPDQAAATSADAKPVSVGTEAKDATSDTSDPTSAEDDSESLQEPAVNGFEPPFPDRVALFQAPKRQGRGRIKQEGQSDSAIELLGFVNVNGPRVALSIDGMVKTAAEGDKHFGIEVISIQPPAVVLQRGRQRWQATFDN